MINFTSRTRRLISAGVAVAILIAGLAYVSFHTIEYESTAKVVLVPRPTSSSDIPNLLDSFERSNTIGTYVELIGSNDTKELAGSPPVSVTVRGIPGTRALMVTATGAKERVVPALEALVAASRLAQPRLNDPWRLTVIARASKPTRAGPSTAQLLLATVVLSILGALLALTALRRIESVGDAEDVDSQPVEDAGQEEDEPLELSSASDLGRRRAGAPRPAK